MRTSANASIRADTDDRTFHATVPGWSSKLIVGSRASSKRGPGDHQRTAQAAETRVAKSAGDPVERGAATPRVVHDLLCCYIAALRSGRLRRYSTIRRSVGLCAMVASRTNGASESETICAGDGSFTS